MRQPVNRPQSNAACSMFAVTSTPDAGSLEESRRAAFLRESARYLGLMQCADDRDNQRDVSSKSAFSWYLRQTN